MASEHNKPRISNSKPQFRYKHTPSASILHNIQRESRETESPQNLGTHFRVNRETLPSTIIKEPNIRECCDCTQNFTVCRSYDTLYNQDVLKALRRHQRHWTKICLFQICCCKIINGNALFIQMYRAVNETLNKNTVWGE